MSTTIRTSSSEDNLPAAELIAWRRRLGLSQDEAAAVLGVARRTYQGWEKEGAGRLQALACAAVLYGAAPIGMPGVRADMRKAG